MSLQRTLLSNSVFRVLNIIAQFFITILLTRLMGVEGYGSFSLLVAAANVFNLLTSLGLEAGITYHTASGKISLGGIAWLSVCIVGFQILLWLGIDLAYLAMSGGHIMGDLLQGWQLPAVIALIISISLTDKLTALFNGYHFYTLLNKTLLYTNLAILAVFAACWLLIDRLSPDDYILLFVTGALLQWVILLIIFLQHKEGPFTLQRVPMKLLANLFSFIMIVYAANLVQFLAYRADYWILEHYHPHEKELGWYALAVKLVQFFWIVPNLLATILLPNVAAQSSWANSTNISRLLRIMNGINLFLGLMSILVVALIIRIFFGADYAPSAGLFLWLLPGTLLFCSATVLAAYFSGINKPIINLYGSLICLVVVIVLDLLLIPGSGKEGAAIASMLAYSVTTIYMIAVFCIKTAQPVTSLLIPGKQDIQSFYQTIQKLIGKK